MNAPLTRRTAAVEDAMMKNGTLPRIAVGAILWLASPPAWSLPPGSLDTWVDTCELENRDLLQLLGNEALIVDQNVISPNADGSYTLAQQSYTHSGIQPPLYPLCNDSRFYGQPQVNGTSFRSAVQVGPDLVLTAWHAAAPAVPPVVVVFGLQYRMLGDSCVPPDFTHIPAENVYWPKEVVADGWTLINKDFLLLRLDREASPTFPRVRRSGQGRPGDAMTMIAHPDRLATKVDLAGSLVGYSGSDPFVSPGVVNLHTLVGSSGSMVYNRAERFVETVTRFGVGTYLELDQAAACYRVRHTDATGYPNYSVKYFAPYIPPFELLVTPLDTVVHVGPVGGPFTNPTTSRTISVHTKSPASVEYHINTLSITGGQPHLLLSFGGPLRGTLTPGESFASQETFNADQAPCGVHERTYKASDTTHGFTDVVRHVFEIGLGEVTVTPVLPQGITDLAKPFEDTVTYTVTNVRPSPISVTVTADQGWLRLNGVGGPAPSVSLDLPPYGAAAVAVSLDPALTLPYGDYAANLHFAAVAGAGCPAVPAVDRVFSFTWGRESFTDATSVAVPDGSRAGVTRLLSVPESFCIDDVNVSVLVTGVPSDDLLVRLTSPLGTSRLLWDHADNGGEALWVKFDDDGPFPPVEPLSALNGEPGAGPWQLQVIDDVPGGGPGQLYQWGLELRARPCP
jgi:subtilisin-like proprotein convertase family protein